MFICSSSPAYHFNIQPSKRYNVATRLVYYPALNELVDYWLTKYSVFVCLFVLCVLSFIANFDFISCSELV